MILPSETEFISVFGVRPIKKDENEEFEFDTSTFAFETETESLEVILSPFYNELTVIVTHKERQEITTHLKLRSIEALEIVKENEKEAIRLLYGESESYIHKLELVFKPHFRMTLQEVYL